MGGFFGHYSSTPTVTTHLSKSYELALTAAGVQQGGGYPHDANVLINEKQYIKKNHIVFVLNDWSILVSLISG